MSTQNEPCVDDSACGFFVGFDADFPVVCSPICELFRECLQRLSDFFPRANSDEHSETTFASENPALAPFAEDTVPLQHDLGLEANQRFEPAAIALRT